MLLIFSVATVEVVTREVTNLKWNLLLSCLYQKLMARNPIKLLFCHENLK